MVDYRALVAALVRYYVFLVIGGLCAILYLLPEFSKSRLTIAAILGTLFLVYIVIRDQEQIGEPVVQKKIAYKSITNA
jgi:heme A synthase